MNALWPLMVLLAFAGLAALASEHARVGAGNGTQTDAASAASSFLVYRNAVVAYLDANRGAPASGGALSTAAITPYLPAGDSSAGFPAGAGNIIVVGSGSQRTAYVYATMIPGELSAMVSQYQGDASFGSVTNGQWSSVLPGIEGSVPGGVPSGAIISVVQVGD